MALRADRWFIDMDKTAILPYTAQIPTSWDMMNHVAGLGDVGMHLLQRYHPYPEQYEAWVGELASHYRGRDAYSIQAAVIAATQLRPGLREFTHYVRVQNPHAKQGIISAGLEFVAAYVAGVVGLDFHEGIELKVDGEGKFTGEVVIKVHETDKVTPAQRHLGDVAWTRAAHIGDGRSDISLWKRVGHAFGIGVSEDYREHVTESFDSFYGLIDHLRTTGKTKIRKNRQMF
ncbi:haloacid dehalogenase-like hydrolase [Candidatus Woesearchaeota archaeon]|nr:haloacid dehalogenase-like hydrolase [Candidatus Woesearchaeota archaeon]